MGATRFTELIRPGAVKRLLIRGTNWLGDGVMMAPALKALRRGFPDAHLVLLAKPAVAELFQNHPAIDEIILYRNPGTHAGIGGKWRLARLLRSRRFDVAVLFQNAFEAALLAAAAGIPYRYGYPTDGRGFLLTHRVARSSALFQAHQVEYYLELLRPLGFPITPEAPVLYTTAPEDREAAARIQSFGVLSEQPIIGVNPGSTYGTAKRWLPERYAELAERLAAEYQAHVLIFGGRGEEALGRAIAAMLTSPHTVLSGHTTVRQLMALVKQCRLFLTNDAGPMHIAAALGVRVVAVFGPTDPRTTAPFGSGHELVRHPVDCSPCLLRECPIDHRCMRGIQTEQVYSAAVRQLQEAGVSPLALSSLSISKDTPSPHEAEAGMSSHSAPVVFLDRDGTLNWDPGYLNDPVAMRLLPGVGGAVARLNQAGLKTVLVTNQSGVGRGIITIEALGAIHQRLQDLLAESGAWLDGIYACLHRPDEGCGCRKPASGLVAQARQELGLTAARSFVIGDRALDIALARNVGALGIFVLSGFRPEEERVLMVAQDLSPDYTAKDLTEAVDWVLQNSAAADSQESLSLSRTRHAS
ncbi:MAG TPA: lipopolysaccharide heptosyltransferase II [Nitrospirales bacterium]